jgi:hypothetical protein
MLTESASSISVDNSESILADHRGAMIVNNKSLVLSLGAMFESWKEWNSAITLADALDEIANLWLEEFAAKLETRVDERQKAGGFDSLKVAPRISGPLEKRWYFYQEDRVTPIVDNRPVGICATLALWKYGKEVLLYSGIGYTQQKQTKRPPKLDASLLRNAFSRALGKSKLVGLKDDDPCYEWVNSGEDYWLGYKYYSPDGARALDAQNEKILNLADRGVSYLLHEREGGETFLNMVIDDAEKMLRAFSEDLAKVKRGTKWTIP